jgi:hypothetical protein
MQGVKVLAALALLLSDAGAVVACEGSPVLFADHFDSYDLSWGLHGDELAVQNGQMIMRPEVDTIDWQPNDRASYTDVDVCVNATIVQSITPEESFVGLMFWFKDDDNFYAFEIDTAGHAAIWRRVNGDWRSPVPWGPTPLVPVGDGKTVRLRVVTKGKTATAYVNDVKFMDVTADAAIPGGSQVGVLAGSPMAGVSVNTFDDFIVTKPN